MYDETEHSNTNNNVENIISSLNDVSNFEMGADFKASTNRWARIGIVDSNDELICSYGFTGSYTTIGEVITPNGSVSVNNSGSANTYYNVRFVKNNDNLKIYVDNSLIIENTLKATTTPYKFITLAYVNPNTMTYKNVKIKPL